MDLTFSLNGTALTLDAPSDQRVVDLFRETLGLTGTKEGCGSGECGACTIMVDGQTRLACLMVAAQLQGRSVITIEGLDLTAQGREQRHPVQEAFVQAGAIQCGFCTPGMVLTVTDLINRSPHADETEIRRAISGNLCRCTGYQKIVEAAQLAARWKQEEP
ncbi:MAG: (2Fe-2S)-binding protein [Pseudomonadota bacterium]